MPLRATSDTGDQQAFEFNDLQWAELKSNYKALNLRMPCCKVPAIPKTSTLGNFFFAHARRGECTTAPESAEHIFCKVLIAKAAQSAGWTVTTERAGVSPDGDIWVADVFCEKGTAKVALEVQMSPQSLEEARRRQARYEASDVRGAWFYGQKLREDVAATTKALPMFGLSDVKVGQEPLVGTSSIELSDFVTALLRKRITWVRPLSTKPFYIAVLRRVCRSCKRPEGLSYGHAETLAELPTVPVDPAEAEAALGRLFNVITNEELQSLGLSGVSQVHQGNRKGIAYWNSCHRASVSVPTTQLCSSIEAAANGPSELSGLEYVYFDRNALDSGAWAFVTDDGEFQSIGLAPT